MISSLSAQFEKDKDVSVTAHSLIPRLRSKCANRFPYARTLIRNNVCNFWSSNNTLCALRIS